MSWEYKIGSLEPFFDPSKVQHDTFSFSFSFKKRVSGTSSLSSVS
jgi:hypothetical protein